MKCPRDKTELKKKPIETTHQCSTCDGEYLIDADVFIRIRSGFHKLYAFTQPHCPLCQSTMDTYRFDEGGLDIDICFQCEGIWLDKSEKDKLRKYISIQSRKTGSRIGLRKKSSAYKPGIKKNINKKEKNTARKYYEEYQQRAGYTSDTTVDGLLLQLSLGVPVEHNLEPFRCRSSDPI